MRIEINKAHFPVTVLGPGRRIGIWLQGCHIRCAGCMSHDTWDADSTKRIDVADLLAWCAKITQGVVDGITISGGEPFGQPEALLELLEGIHAWRSRLTLPVDILCYSGYPWRKLLRDHPAILHLLDAIIPEPFVQKLPQAHIWRGSSNQVLIPLSELGHARYAKFRSVPSSTQRGVQVAVSAHRIWLIGIPKVADLEALHEYCESAGISQEGMSWR